MKRAGELGITLLGVWLILSGLIGIIGLQFIGLGSLMAGLALVAGILIVLGR